MLEQQAAQIDALDRRSMRAVLPALLDARAELRSDLSRWLAKHPDGDDQFTAQQLRRALLALEGSLQRVDEIREDMAGALRGNSAAAASLSASHLGQQVATGAALFGESIYPTNIEAAALIARGEKLLFKHYDSSAKRYAGQVGEDIRHQLAVGVAKGETFAQLKARLVRLGGPGPRTGVAAEDIANGLFRRHRYWAERLVRTEMISAYNQHHQEGINLLNETRDEQQTDEYLQRWDASLDKRACKICRDLNERCAKPGESFPGGITRPPAHPCCRCVLVAWHASWGDIVGKVPATAKATASAAAPPPAQKVSAKPPPAAAAADHLAAVQAAAGAKAASSANLPAAPPPKPAKPKLTQADLDAAKAKTAAAQAAAAAAKEAAAQAKAALLEAKRAAAAQLKADLAAKKAASAAAKAKLKAAAVPAEKVLVLPPAPSRFTAAERARYRREALSEIAQSRKEWSDWDGAKWIASGGPPMPGMTYSQGTFNKIRDGFAGKLSPKELDAALFYSHKGDRVLNSALREGRLGTQEEAKTREIAARLDAAIRKHRMTEDTYVSRGMSGEWAKQFAARIQPGDVFQERGYTSTAATVPFDGAVQMRIRIPRGAAAGPIPTRYPSEDEFLLPRGSKFRVVEKRQVGDMFHVELELVDARTQRASPRHARGAAKAAP